MTRLSRTLEARSQATKDFAELSPRSLSATPTQAPAARHGVAAGRQPGGGGAEGCRQRPGSGGGGHGAWQRPPAVQRWAAAGWPCGLGCGQRPFGSRAAALGCGRRSRRRRQHQRQHTSGHSQPASARGIPHPLPHPCLAVHPASALPFTSCFIIDLQLHLCRACSAAPCSRPCTALPLSGTAAARICPVLPPCPPTCACACRPTL